MKNHLSTKANIYIAAPSGLNPGVISVFLWFLHCPITSNTKLQTQICDKYTFIKIYTWKRVIVELSYNGETIPLLNSNLSNTTPLPEISKCFAVVGQWVPINSPTAQAIAMTVGYSSEIDSKTPIAECVTYLSNKTWEIMLEMTWKLHPHWLEFTVLEVYIYPTPLWVCESQ